MSKPRPRATIRARDEQEFRRWERRVRAIQERLKEESKATERSKNDPPVIVINVAYPWRRVSFILAGEITGREAAAECAVRWPWCSR